MFTFPEVGIKSVMSCDVSTGFLYNSMVLLKRKHCHWISLTCYSSQVLLPFIAAHQGTVLQQDKAQPPCCKAHTKLLHNSNIKTLPWPELSSYHPIKVYVGSH